MTDKKDTIRDKFEAALVLGLQGQAVVDETTGEVHRNAPEASFLSVTRAYLKDLMTPADKALPVTGDPVSPLLRRAATAAGLPFGARVQ